MPDNSSNILPVPRNLLPVSSRICLVPVSTVRIMYGCVAEEVTADVEAGKYLWVFDFNRRDGRRRDFRFWVGELADRPAAQALQLKNVINEILPPRRANYPTGEIQHRFLISRSKWMQLRHWMNLPAGSAPREALAAWLKSQWAGGKAK